jgi:inositol-phosphate phosphatase / L-galactose 1-phosphate phosphatase / histidinol-phosphatase
MKLDYAKNFSDFFQELAEAAGTITLQYFRQNIPVDDKDDRSPVTQADREIEQKLRELIRKKFPDHGIIGEEYGQENETAEFVWVIDPIDGTKSFITGRPLFGTIIGLLHEGKPVVGLIEQAYTRERWFGVSDSFARHNGQTIKVAPPRVLENARLYIGSISMFEGKNFPGFLHLSRAVKLPQFACDCYAYGLLAMGWADLVVEQRLRLYDVAGVVPIVTGAGGFISDWEGQPITINFNGSAVAATSRALALAAAAVFENAV